jgi:hypothetical protein
MTPTIDRSSYGHLAIGPSAVRDQSIAWMSAPVMAVE